MTTVQVYPKFYKTSGELNTTNCINTTKILKQYIGDYNKGNIHSILLDNTFINNKNIKINGYSKKYKNYTVFSKNKKILKDTSNEYRKIYNIHKITNLQNLICYHIKLYNIMGIKNYKGRIKYVIAMNSIKYLETTQSSSIIDYKKLYNQVFNKIKF